MLDLEHECRQPEVCNGIDSGSSISSDVLDGGDSPDIEETEEEEFRTYKDESTLVDQQSTGRKRAAKMYPLDETALCEWAMKKNAGGGKFPITGCLNGLQQARHHGPSKNTLDNYKGNVHRICHQCHNRWHTLNDEGYIWGGVYEPHAPREATILDIASNEEFWEGRKIAKAKD